MDYFSPKQRFTSEGEPELGIGICKETSKGRVQIHFPVPDETRLYATENAPLRRVIFKVGDTIADSNQQAMLVEQVELVNNLYMYFGKEGIISEADLGDVSISHSIEDKLFMGDVDAPQLFALRRETLQQDYKRKLSPVNGFLGGRIDLIPHQLYIAHEVSNRYAPRVLLSDQVGLGKTIEACLILHRLLMNGRISRVLILVPDSLVHQWFVEVLRRFNLWFNIFDEERCEALDDNAPEGNPFLDDQLIICSTDFLANSEKRARQAISASWDMLVVDEAHHLEWSVDKVSPEYAIVEMLSQIAKGLLLLTATPEQLGLESHFARLRLLDPERYSNFETFKNESYAHKNIANIVEKLSKKKSLTKKDTALLATLFPKERIESLSKGGDTERNNIIEDILDQHGPGRVLFRNTRSAISGFPKRKVHLIPLTPEKDNGLLEKRMSGEFIADLQNTSPHQRFKFSDDPRFTWLLKTMDDLQPEKVLLICKTKEKVQALESAIAKKGNLKVGVFHEDLTIVQRDRNAAWFSENDGARLLLCSEIGSEGRNFQFAHHLILFDLPFHPELLEQRIGRLDRIGQKKDIQIHVPYLENSPQEILVQWYHKGLNAFEENLEGGNKISKLFSPQLLDICGIENFTERKQQLDKLIHETAEFQKELKVTLADGRDRLLEMNSFRPAKAKELVNQIQSEDLDLGLEKYFTKVFEQFDVEMEDLASRTYLLYPAPTNTEPFPHVPPEGISVTFDRKRALSREDIRFLTWDHPMTTSAMDMVLSSGTGSASFGVLRGSGSPGLLMELQFVLETAGEQSIYVDRFLPNTPIRIVVDHTGKEVTDLYPIEKINKQLTPGQIGDLLDNEMLTDTLIPHMISSAKELASTQAEVEISKGLGNMNSKLNYEIERLQLLHKINKDIRPEEIQIAVEEQSMLANLIKNARVRMDALQLIRKE